MAEPLTWEQFITYMETFKKELTDTYSNRQACRERHRSVEDDIKFIKRTLFWAATAIITISLGVASAFVT